MVEGLSARAGVSYFFITRDAMGMGGIGLGIDEKFIFREKNGCTPNNVFQKIGNNP